MRVFSRIVAIVSSSSGSEKLARRSLFSYLSQHRDICASRVKETMYFLPMSEAHVNADGRLSSISEYEKFFDRCKGQCYRMEATPHYFHGGLRLARAIDSTLPGARVVLTLREPVSRAWSIYRFAKHMLMIPKEMKFAEFVERGIEIHDRGTRLSRDIGPYWTSIAGSMYAEFVEVWLAQFGERAHIVFFDDLAARPLDVVKSACRWLDIDPEAFFRLELSVENRTGLFRNRALHRVAHAVNSEHVLRNHRSVKRWLRHAYWLVNGIEERETMQEATRKQLVDLFRDSNAVLARQLSSFGVRTPPAWVSTTSCPPSRVDVAFDDLEL